MDGTAISPYARALEQVRYVPPPVVEKPSVWQTYRQILTPAPEAPGHVSAAVDVVRYNAESMGIAALLGLIYGKAGTLDVRGVPMDGVASVIFAMLSVREAGKPGGGFSQDFLAASQSCSSVAMFRKTASWVQPSAQATLPERGDPLVAAAKKLDL
jgi:hypothetical protein